MDLDSIISKKSELNEEKKCSSLSEKVQFCQSKMLKLEEELNTQEESNKEDENRYPYRRMIISNIYTLLGELASQAQSRMAKRLEAQYIKSQKFKTRERKSNLSSESAGIDYSRLDQKSYNSYDGSLDHDQDLDPGMDELTPEMEKAAQELLNHFTSDLDALRESQNQLHEISSLMSFFSSKIQEQSEICSTILADANDAVDYLDESKIYLEKMEEAYGARG
ncbi:unnamed protein product [Cryptosporidium hominis]|uniref:t-SNARE coiled-coil homology domain-containing protein n=1 Tax=Cryptosporidium hominis TaxID=237895 RepID=A0A0S4TL21_CRYHO|nr:hypothetical protein [Cryptosporidium hominis TU502]PPS97975.1 Uncharacterized protein GY17_00000969 [Cryptosporidium hominis]CUV08069.1 unnamed protein product [Cryptosporidium hominis]|eukprot:PPS97975.1 Uncharacterized protein GY17_00000969 [Cryptosporidium hominis]